MAADDLTPTDPQPVDVLEAQVEELRKSPKDVELFAELRAALRKAGQPAKLAVVCEVRAPHEPDPIRAAAIWSEAGEARFHVGDDERGEEDLRRALALDPANERAAARMAERLLVLKRYAEAADVMEAELAALEQKAGENGADGKHFVGRRALRHRMLGQLWDVHLGRVDRALHHWQRAWQLEPHASEAIEAARAIYASLGDDKMVARLYELELEAIGEKAPRDRRARLEHALGMLIHRRGDAAGAVAHLERALRLAPDDDRIKEDLAEVYAQAAWPTEEPLARTVELYLDLARRRLKADDAEGATGFLRRALGIDPRSEAAQTALEGVLTAGERWSDLERHYRQRVELAVDDAELTDLLARRARILEEKLGEREAAKRCWEALAAREPAGGPASQRLRELYQADGDWTELAALIERELESPTLPDERRVAELLELASIAREHLNERDRAAECLHKVLSVQPNHAEALARYADHFREKRDWRGLADLAEFAVEAAREAGLPEAEVVRRLEELAQVSELRLGDVERAIAAWRRVEELDPDSGKAREATRRLLSRARMWESLVSVLEKEAAAAAGPRERADALKRIAQVYRERQVDPRRAIALYEEALGLWAADPAALKALAELYEREGDDAGLCRTLRRQLDADAERLGEDARREGRRAPTAREWPTAMRVERLTTLRRLANMYETRLGDVEGVVYACTGILELLPGDRDALERLERVLEKAGDVERLEQTLEYHAEAATGPAERGKVLKRLARLAGERGDDLAATDRWERVMRAAPNDPEALAALSTLYERVQRWQELAIVLERLLVGKKPAEPGSAAAAARAAELKRYARVVDARLGDANRAVKAWRQVLEILPRDREALDALARLHEARGDWRDLVDVLGRQAPLYLADDRKKSAAAALARARLLEERLGAPREAAEALEALIRDLDPANLEAHGALRRLYEARGDFEAAVRVAERELYLTEDPAAKTARGLEIGVLCRDRLGDARRALQAYERVLLYDPDLDEALVAVAELYARVGDWPRHIRALEKLAARAPEGRDRRTLYLRIAHAVAERLGDGEDAFGWFCRAHEHAPDATTLDELRRAAEAHGLWEPLAEVFEKERRRLGGAAVLAVCRELAGIYERRLGDRRRALAVLKDAVAVAPTDDGQRRTDRQGSELEALIAEAERIAGDAADRHAWRALLELYGIALERRRGVEARVALRERCSRVREERLDDPRGAMDELLAAFALDPAREATREGILRLAERTKRWDDAIAVETALLVRARTADRLGVARRIAALLEERVGDRVRAFRAWLRAFAIAPEDADVSANLWRLAKAIGRYEEAEKQAAAEPAPARIEAHAVAPAPASAAPPPPPPPGARAGAAPPRIEGSRAREDATQELTASDLLEATGPLARAAAAGGVAPTTPERPDATIELKTEDLIAALGAKSPPPPPPSSSPSSPSSTSAVSEAARKPGVPPPPGRKPPPPPRLPGVHPRPTPKPAPPPPPRASRPATPPPAPVPLPQAVPARPYESPWEELATAYESLPAPDAEAKLRNLFRAAEVWERGAEDVGRAFETLARALKSAPGDGAARDRLWRLASEHDAWDRLAELYEDAAERAGSPDTAAALLAEIAEIRGRQGRARDAEAILRRILGMRPDDETAREKLEAMLRAEGRWVDLAASLEERTDPRLGSAAPEAQRPPLLRELAAIYDEKLGKPYEAVGALERLRAIHDDDPETLEALAALYSKVGRWAKVVEVLTRVADVAEGEDRAREARRRVAQIYEKEMDLPDRAIEAYQALVSGWPDDALALEHLERLLEATAHWADLADVLRRRAALAQDPAARAALLRRRARVLLDWVQNPDEAVACLRHARTLTPDDPTLADDMVTALVKSGRAREAAAVIEGRAATLEKQGAAPGDVAALLLRLAALRAEELEDKEGARRVLEKVLARVPDHPSALAALARLARATGSPRQYADALLREAAAAVDVRDKVRALLEAGATLRDRVDDLDGAREAFRRVLELEPTNAEATWALSALAAGGGDLDTAAQLLERRLAEPDLPALERARVLTELAALAQRAGVPAAAERRLDEALQAKPDHLPAVIARADLYSAAGEWERIEAFLKEALPQLAEAPAAARAELERRLAHAYEKLGRDDEAFALLLEADKLHRNDLLIKLALGENRYRARRWREAALHLSGLADHPDAPTRAAEVAEGLYHAALAEIRALRPERAVPLYEAALRLKPDHAPALHALAEVEIERGNVARAADLLERQAAATADHAERLRLFEALGDLALVALDDKARARTCFEAAVAAAAPLESRHVPLLEKLLDCQRASGEHLRAGLTCELMASFGADGPSRAARMRDAAECYLAARDRARARAAAERAVEADPFDESAIWMASELMLEQGDAEAAASLLGRALGALPPADEVRAPRRAELWRRLGDARRTRGDARGAIQAFEKAVAEDPLSDGGIASRRALVAMLRDDAAQADAVRRHLRALIDAEQRPGEVLALARALSAETAAGPVDEDGGRATLELAAALGEILSDDDRAYLLRHPARVLAADEAYGGALDDADRAALIADPDDEPLAAVMSAVWDAAALLWPDAARALEAAGVAEAERVPPTAKGAAAAIYPQVVKVLAAPATVLWVSRRAGAPDVALACASPPLVVLGPRLLGPDGAAGADDAELRFLFGRAVELARPERIAAVGLPPLAFARLVVGLVRAFGGGKRWLPPDVGDAEADAEADRLRKTLTLKTRMKVEPLLEKAAPERLDPARYRAACERAADRAGLVVSGDIHAAVRLVGGPANGRHLVQLAVKERYLAVRAKIGIGCR